MEQHENELTGSYALNALNETERQELFEHSERSSAIRDEIDALTGTATLLGLSAAPVAPPARVKTNIMAAIKNTAQLPAETSPMTSSAADAPAEETLPAQATEDAQTPPVQPVVPVTSLAAEREARRPARFSTRVLGIAAGALFVASAGLASVVISQNVQQEKLETQLADAGKNQAELTRLLTASDVKSATQTLKDGARVTLAYSAGEGMMAVTTAGLPALPTDKGYEFWLISDEGAVSAGLLSGPDPDTMTLVNGSMQGITHFGISVEPSGGSPEPTTTPILVQEL
ncbi:anti-sigma factor [Paeniglutamicibacter cryotolerans]|uniref:Regulator of SigK n=1 Tax=Paeniglutamicibacter cryotolerans TaxID=670079 RepID=A0A839QJK9_9MICC|nr:anti-sigma factor [Paeniglutamicibacter cryotolerans]MBB2995783.1 anti-sigma-K factor RskA [Paeniglutamicibacter cryotolerans]